MPDFDWNASFEWLAAEFYKLTGYTAPGKDLPLSWGYTEEDEQLRQEVWKEFMETKTVEAFHCWFQTHDVSREEIWENWHRHHGMLKS